MFNRTTSAWVRCRPVAATTCPRPRTGYLRCFLQWLSLRRRTKWISLSYRLLDELGGAAEPGGGDPGRFDDADLFGGEIASGYVVTVTAVLADGLAWGHMPAGWSQVN